MKTKEHSFIWKSVFIELTNKCNLNCPYCYNSSSFSNNEMLSLDNINTIIDWVRKVGIRHVELSGGEPCLFPGLLDIIKTLEGFGISVSLITNTSLFTESLITNTNSRFQITLDGATSEIHSITRPQDNFNSVFRAISLISKNNAGHRVNLRVNMSNFNIMQIEDFVQIALLNRIKTLTFAPLIIVGRGKNEYERFSIYTNTNEANNTINKIKALSNKHIQDLLINYPRPSEAYGCPLYSDTIEINGKIDSYGYLYACSLFTNSKFSLCKIDKEIDTQKIEAELENLLQYIEKYKHDLTKCNSCITRSICEGGCVATMLESEIGHRDACNFLRQGYYRNFKSIIESKNREVI